MSLWKKTPELVAEAKSLLATGLTLREVGHRLDVSHKTIERWTDPACGERDRQRRKARYEANRPHAKQHNCKIYYLDAQAKRDGEVLLRQIPPDTRDLTARLCGDPLPGRRAIDLKPKPAPAPSPGGAGKLAEFPHRAPPTFFSAIRTLR